MTSTTEAWSQSKLLPGLPNPKVELMGGIKIEPTAKHILLREGTTNWTGVVRRGVAENFSQYRVENGGDCRTSSNEKREGRALPLSLGRE